MNNNQEKSSYKETGDKVTSILGAIGAGLESTAKEVSKNLDISNLGKTIIKWSPKPISSTLNVHSIATAQGEKEVFTEAYKMGVSGVTSGLGGGIGVVGCAVIPFINTATPVCAGVGAGFGNWLGNEIAQATADIVYPLYKATKDSFMVSKSSQTTSYTPSKAILTTLDTSQPLLHLNVFLEDSFIPVHNATIRLIPFRTMIANKTQDSIQEQTIQNGKVSFNLPSNAEKFEFCILDKRYYKKAKGDKGERVTNNYSNTPNPTITLNLIAKISLYFNGYELQIHQNNKIIESFNAYSGNALSEKEKVDLQNNKGYEKFIAYRDSTQRTISYFCLDTEWQKEKDKGAIPEGIYYIDINNSKDDKSSGIREYNNALFSISRTKEGEKQWGKYNIPIYTDKDCTNTIESNTQRNNFYIHGGESYGDNGGIDLSKEDTRFFQVLESLKQEYKDILETLKDDKGRIIIKLEVGYERNNLCLSGKEWVKEYKDKASIEDLSSPFKENVKDFLKAIKEAKDKTPQAKIAYYISSTCRPYKRAVLMHYCHKVAYNNITPKQAQIETQKENIPINWIHTDSSGNYSEKISRAKALEMVKAYGIAYPASLTSHHVAGNAIDITITWQSSFKIKDKIGKIHTIDIPRNGATNQELRKVGETYGVKRTLEKDPPHWSLEGN